MTATRFSIEVRPVLPVRIARLAELADDLLYSWDRKVRGLFHRLDPVLWEACRHNPKVFLRRVSQTRLDNAETDRGFMEVYNLVLSAYDTYHQAGMRSGLDTLFDPAADLIAYFCAEFGLHESLPIYSGGLGILAGDHCKACSDLGVPFVAVGLLYRQGYFNQTIDEQGRQHALYTPTDFGDLPIRPALGADGRELRVQVPLPGRSVNLRIWQAKAGHITLYLLDSDLAENAPHDRAITYQLYGGDSHTRIQQELVLGVGGVRALRALGLKPSVWHINEGHAAFQILARVMELVAEGQDFQVAQELVAAATVFTTHTPVAAGHDIFHEPLITEYLNALLPTHDVPQAMVRALGEHPGNATSFNMTSFAVRGSRFHNGVSRIHGGVASVMESYLWPQIPPEENPIAHITNGVHLNTFLAREWSNLFDSRFPDWRNEVTTDHYWECLDSIPDHRFWSLRLELKHEMLKHVAQRAILRMRRNGQSELDINRLLKLTEPPGNDVLVMGFARRFATYKRATLMLRDPDRLAALLNNPARPALLIFAGKAHPYDEPGQSLIRDIHNASLRKEFGGRIILLEDYDLALARKLVAGVDLWINTPQYPLEASGTSGQKAAINGVLNLSVLDGWWAEGYDGENGWAITPHGPDFDPHYRDHEESNDLLGTLEQEILPLYFERGENNYSPGWIRRSKASMKTILPRFNAQRMVMDYVRHSYALAQDHHRRLAAEDARGARELAGWKQEIRDRWAGMWIKLVDPLPSHIAFGRTVTLKVLAGLNGLKPSDVTVECLMAEHGSDAESAPGTNIPLESRQVGADGSCLYTMELHMPESGLKSLRIRAYPHHPMLAHRFEMGRMLWL